MGDNYGSHYGGRGEVAKSVHNAKHWEGAVAHKSHVVLNKMANKYGFD